MDVFGAPLKVMHKFAGAIALLEDESVVEQLLELRKHVDVRVV
jgi:hypothetical protein